MLVLNSVLFGDISQYYLLTSNKKLLLVHTYLIQKKLLLFSTIRVLITIVINYFTLIDKNCRIEIK